MAKSREDRWYEVEQDCICIYDNGYKSKSCSVSVIYDKKELSYYRNNFNLRKVWSE